VALLGVLVKLRKKKVLTSSCLYVLRLSVFLSVRMEQLGSHWTDFCKI